MKNPKHVCCRWVHMSQYCEWEWGGGGDDDGAVDDDEEGAGVARTGCTLAGVERIGNYSEYECGISFTVKPHHRGVWLCELEKYHPGFARR